MLYGTISFEMSGFVEVLGEVMKDIEFQGQKGLR